MDAQDGMRTVSIEHILNNYQYLGVPHFQRGSVWTHENVSALLESLYHGTPCGSIVLWARGRHQQVIVIDHGLVVEYL